MSVDGGSIDESHKKLISLVNRLHLVMNCGADCDSVANILCELADYAGAGFLEEEKVMDIVRYPDRDAHIVEHWVFIDRLSIFIADFERGVLIGNEVLMFLIRWLASHVKSRDGALRAYLALSDRHQPCSHSPAAAVAA